MTYKKRNGYGQYSSFRGPYGQLLDNRLFYTGTPTVFDRDAYHKDIQEGMDYKKRLKKRARGDYQVSAYSVGRG
mgnify:CR=1 FL=1